MSTQASPVHVPGAEEYDVAIVGGGLAGLALSIQLAKAGHSVVVFEKEQYPFHRVCGEYISLESWDFLTSLGMDLSKMGLPVITKLLLTDKKGRSLQQELPLGGFGISRYLLDFSLAVLAKAAGVNLQENTKVNDIVFEANSFYLHTSQQVYKAKLACAGFGKRSNIDIKWKREFTTKHKSKLNNYIGVKYHVETDLPADTIALHCFDNGYCGIVKIEGDKYNLCYLSTAANLQKCNNSVTEMEDRILSKNPYLKKLFSGSKKCFDEPVTISQISFDRKSQVENHVLMVGDAAGMIAPLCGNGMSMAVHGSKLAATAVDLFLRNMINRQQMEQQYSRQWQKTFGPRLRMGRFIQRLSGNAMLMGWFIRSGKLFPRLFNRLVRRTHGQAF